MAKVARVNVDQAGGGIILGPGAITVTVNDKSCSIVNDTVATHGDPPHVVPSIVSGAPTVFATDKPISVTSISIASCGHPVSTGSNNVNAV